MNLLETTKLVKTYGVRSVVDEGSFVVGQEEIVGRLGRNGAGKTRTRRMLLVMVVTEPKLILLDEPFSGVDPRAVEDLQAEIKRLKHEFGKSVLITDHNVPQTLKVCERALIINDGRVQFEGTPKQVINDPGVRSA